MNEGRQFSAREQNATVPEREALAIVCAVKKCHAQLHGKHFTLVTDHRPLNYILNSKNAYWKDHYYNHKAMMLNTDLKDKMGAQMHYPEGLTKQTFRMKMTYFCVPLLTNQEKF